MAALPCNFNAGVCLSGHRLSRRHMEVKLVRHMHGAASFSVCQTRHESGAQTKFLSA
jgi:hypothetical protein